MTSGRHGRFSKAIGIMCAIALQFNAFSDWRADWKSFAEETKRSASSCRPSSPPRYSYAASHSQEGPYKPFSAAQKAEILRQNRARNGGVLRSDYSGKILEEPRRCTKGCTPNPNEAQVDHVTPRSRGGWNSAENAQVLSREENLKKSDKLPMVES